MTPEGEAELSEAIASARQPFMVTGGGTRPIGQPVEGVPLVTRRLAGIALYEPGALTMIAGSGTPLNEVEAELARNGQRLPFEPMDHRGLLGTVGEPTIGGMAAANVSGSRRIQAGACRDSMIGVRFVDGLGKIVKNGGRVMKNVTGYDLVKLLAGSFGTLGVLTEVAFKVLPEPECTAVLLVEGLDVAKAIQALSLALASPFEVSGAAHVLEGLDKDPVTMVRLEGFEASVRYRADRLRKELAEFGDVAVETSPDRTAAGWKWVRDVAKFHDVEGDVWRLSASPGDAARISDRIMSSVDADLIFDWGGGLIWALVPRDTDLRSLCMPMSGHATLIRAGRETRERLEVFHPQPLPLARIAARLKEKFDPGGILNPGLMS